TPSAGSIYEWSVIRVAPPPATANNPVLVFSSSAEDPGEVGIATPGTYQARLCIFDECCGWSVPVYQQFVVNPVPADPVFTSVPTDVCTSVNQTYTIQAVPGATYLWEITTPPGAFVTTPTSNTNSVVVNWFAAGTGEIRVRVVSNGCTSSVARATVNIYNIPTVTASISPLVICDGQPVVLSAASATGQQFAFYRNGQMITPPGWTESPNLIINDLANGDQFSVRTRIVATTGFCESALAFAPDVIIRPVPSLSLVSSDADFTICSGDVVTITANVQGVGSPRYVFYRNGTEVLGFYMQEQNFVNVNNLQDGDVISAFVVNFDGTPDQCTSELAFAGPFTVVPAPPFGDASANPSCGAGTGSITLSFTGGPESLFRWQRADNVNPNFANIPGGSVTNPYNYTFPALGAGVNEIYFRIVSLDPGYSQCGSNVASDTVVYYVVRNPTVTGTTVCVNTAATVTATGACSACIVRWFDDPAGTVEIGTGTSLVLPNMQASRTVYAAVEYPGGCRSQVLPAVITVINPQAPVAPNVSRCGTGTVTLTVTPDASCPGCVYEWYDATGTTLLATGVSFNTPVLTNTTVYRVRGSVPGAGCFSPFTNVQAIIHAFPTVSIAQAAAICAGQTTTLNATAGPGTYDWQPAAAVQAGQGTLNPVVNPAATTLFTFTVTDANNCAASATVLVVVNPVPTVGIVAGDLTLCPGQTTTLTAAGATNFQWSGGLGTGAVVTVGPGTYTVTGTQNGCSSTATVTVSALNPPNVVVAQPTVSICPGSSGQLQASGAVSYLWQPTAGLSNAGIANPTANPSQTTVYTVTGTDAEGCTNTATVQVVVFAAPTITVFAEDDTLCPGECTRLVASGANAYLWSDGQSGAAVTVCPSQTTTYTVTGTTGDGCVGTATTTVYVVPPAQATVVASATAVCPNGTTTLTATGSQSYVWQPAAGISGPNNQAVVTAQLGSLPVTYTVTATDANGCVDTETITVNVNPLPSLAVNGPLAICPGDSAQLQASGADAYVWLPSAGLSNAGIANPKASPAVSTTYTVTGYTALGCSTTRTVFVEVRNRPNIVGSASSAAICSGQSVTLTATGGVSYSWGPPVNQAGASVTFTPQTVGQIVVVVTGSDANNCQNTDTATVFVRPLPAVEALAGSASVCPGFTTTLTAAGAGPGAA
ncbi:MAG: hypothetical protein NZ534_05015, partial [Bacteroidia bacterium]|nr:hypothetical protein [Bacteroidia bacterium]